MQHIMKSIFQNMVFLLFLYSSLVGSLIANAMKQNQDLLYSLTHFDLSENPLGPDSQGPLVFLKEPQTVTTLNLSKCGLNFELVSKYIHSVIHTHTHTLILCTCI